MDQTTRSSSSSYKQNHPRIPLIKSKPTYLNSLHSVRKPLQKPINKHYIAPLARTPPKIYNIDSDNFKETVRVLTSTPEFQYPSSRRLKDIAPPPLVLSTIPKTSLFPKPTPLSPLLEGGGDILMSPLSNSIKSPGFCNLLNETLHTTKFASASSSVDYDASASSGAMISPLFNLSPASLSWCSSILLSPENLSAIN